MKGASFAFISSKHSSYNVAFPQNLEPKCGLTSIKTSFPFVPLIIHLPHPAGATSRMNEASS